MGEKAVSDERHLKWWPPPSRIYYFSILVTWPISSNN